jgi:hypothetical protein
MTLVVGTALREELASRKSINETAHTLETRKQAVATREEAVNEKEQDVAACY